MPQSALAAAAHLRFELDLAPGESSTAARIIVRQDSAALREIVLDGARLQKATGDGEITLRQGQLRWAPPATGGTLRYQVPLSHRRQGKTAPGNDAWVGAKFAVFRGEDAFPIRAWRRTKDSGLTGELIVRRPDQWSLITPYLPDALGRLTIRNPGQRMARPVGWITAGDLGTRRDTIADIEIIVTAPRGERMERVAMLGLLRWTLPQLVQQLATAESRPRYISVVAAGPPLWLGALSAPNSIFVHSDRPLISENGTSTIVHEMVHVLLADLDTPREQDWIDEGLAEYLSLRALRDSGTISALRYEATIAEFRRWGGAVTSLRTPSSTGPVTARAVTVFADLDTELRKSGRNGQSLALLIKGLLESGRRADLATLRQGARKMLGRDSLALAPAAVPGLD
ncbi:MAG: hypothetical protein EXR82_06070 [Gammaproteobacteria bacterium]|nr:hypothetical protein [Gammaproteobacteria bacterium]